MVWRAAAIRGGATATVTTREGAGTTAATITSVHDFHIHASALYKYKQINSGKMNNSSRFTWAKITDPVAAAASEASMRE